jgi:NADH-dependent peroxiredoxin subunit F
MNFDFKLQGVEPEAKPQFRPASEAERYDVIILGAGPAGSTAAVYCARKGLNVLVITENLGGQVLTTAGIENYSGFQYITGPELAAKFKAQIGRFPLALLYPAKTTKLEPRGNDFAITVFTNPKSKIQNPESQGTFQSRSVIITSGAQPRQLGIPGENELSSRGVTYCATCDAPLYADKVVAVVGGGNSALTSLLDLSAVAREVVGIVRNQDFKGDRILVEKVRQAANVRLLMNRATTRILGQERVTGIEVRERSSGEIAAIKVDGVFIEIGWVPNSEFARGVVELNPAAEIIINDRNETSRPGIFAAGDVTSVREKQIVIAAGEGAKAALAASAWLQARPED